MFWLIIITVVSVVLFVIFFKLNEHQRCREENAAVQDNLEAIQFASRYTPIPTQAEKEAAIQEAIRASSIPNLGVLIKERRTGEVIFSDGYVEAALGLPPGGFLGDTWKTLIDRRDLKTLVTLAVKRSPETDVVHSYLHSNGFKVKLRFRWTRKSTGLDIVYVTDITIKDAEEALLRSASTLRSLL